MNTTHSRGRTARQCSVLMVALATAVLAGCMHTAAPTGLDTATTRLTENGLYRSTITPDAEPIQINRLHEWTVEVRAQDGTPVRQAAIAVDGGMPQHGHGLPTKPRVTGEVGDGRYRVEGMKFNMRGWWTISLRIDGPAGPDAVTFNLVL